MPYFYPGARQKSSDRSKIGGPASSMVDWAYKFTYILPSRYFVDIMRAVCLKGSSISDLGFEFTVLAATTILMNAVAVLTYRKRS